jgi:chitinase
VTQNSWDFTAYTVAFAKSAPVTEPTPTPTPTTSTSSPTPTPTPTTSTPGSCTAAAWSSSATYVSGDVVSYSGAQWTANQWNYDEVPGGSSGAWTNDGSC